MANRFTYEIKRSGFNKIITVFDNGKPIYSNNSPTAGDADLERIAKIALKDNYGNDINQMTKIPSSLSPVPNFNQPSPSLNNSQQNLEQQKIEINKISQEQQDKFNNLQNSLQDQFNTAKSTAKAAVTGIIISLIIRFINNDIIINAIISNLIKKTKKKLKNKGRIEVKNKTSIIFYPKFSGDYSPYKQEFERKKASLLKIIKLMITIVDSLIIVLRFIKTALAILQLQLKIKKKKLLATATTSGPDLASSSPVKSIAAKYPLDKEINEQITKDLEKKIENYILLINFIQTILKTLQQILTKAKSKAKKLSFSINKDSNNTDSDNTDSDSKNEDQDNNLFMYVNDGGKSYILKLITLPNKQRQYQALDSFSKMKITQTAPSFTKTNDELLEEIKQILG